MESAPPTHRERIAKALERIAAALERQTALDPIALLGEAITAGPPGGEAFQTVELQGKEAVPIGGGGLFATVKLGALRPGWSLDLYGHRDDPEALSVLLVGPNGEREALR